VLVMTAPMGAVLASIVGAVFGSFLNVVAHRVPRGESISKPRSRCPSCGTQIRAFDNVPVLSWLLLRGRCRGCSAPISARYPLVEAGTAALCALVVLVQGVNADALIGIVLVLLLVPITLIDLDTRRIPNVLTAIGAVAAVGLVAALRTGDLPEHLIAGAAAGMFLLVAVLAYPSGMGMGDVKLAAVLGLFLGRDVAPAMLVALLTGTIVGGVVMARLGVSEGRKTAIPFGPFLALGGLVGLLAGPAIVDWYLATFV
jgi:leader peptidase (prepilin peptidase)/N-methyltransferase